MKKYKQGEKEAKIILETLGYVFDDEYYDDNSQKSMPDLKTVDGKNFEITHTYHNNKAVGCNTKYYNLLDGETDAEMFKRHSVIEIECGKAIERIRNGLYERNIEGKITNSGLAQYNKDCTFIKNHLGYDYKKMDFEERYSEFNCDRPSFHHSIENISKKVIEKGKKHSSGNTDLFIFSTQDEFRLMQECLPQANINVFARSFVSTLYNSPFNNIFVCPWDFIRQVYITDAPTIYRFYKHDSILKWLVFNKNV